MNESIHRWTSGERVFLALPVVAAAVGVLAVLVSERGTGNRPLLAAAALAIGVACALLPFGFAIPVAIVLSTFQGFLSDFAGDTALYWNEAFVAIVVARSLVARRPSRREYVAAGVIAGVYLAYLAAGSTPQEVFWGAKVLLTSVLVGWAVARLGLGERVWRATYYGLAVAIGANLILAVWQKVRGEEALLRLGLEEHLRYGRLGTLRPFGGFTSPSALSYTFTLALLCWLAFVLGRGSERKLGLATAWVPLAALVGIAANRVTLLALSVAVVAVAVREARRRNPVPALALLVVVIGALALPTAAGRQTFVQAFTLSSDSGNARLRLWREFAKELSPFGAGPATAGSAYERVAPPPRPSSLRFLRGWYPLEYGSGQRYRWMQTDGVVALGLPEGARPATRLRAQLRSFRVARTLVVRLGPRTLVTRAVPADAAVPLLVRVPPGRGAARLVFTTTPPALPASSVTPSDPRFLALELRDPRLRGLPAVPGRTPAERIFKRVYDREADKRKLGGTRPGVVDNLYLSWVFQYGLLLGAVLCGAWILVLVQPLLRSAGDSSALAAKFVGVFLLVAALAVNVWEESPVDLIAALILGQAFFAGRREAGAGSPRAGPRI